MSERALNTERIEAGRHRAPRSSASSPPPCSMRMILGGKEPPMLDTAAIRPLGVGRRPRSATRGDSAGIPHLLRNAVAGSHTTRPRAR
jgi:hypothetical protein